MSDGGEQLENDFCPPTDGEVQQSFADLKACISGQWKHFGMQRSMLTGIIISQLRQHFSVLENVDPRLAGSDIPPLYNPDIGSGVLIESIYRWFEAMVEKRPAIIVKPNAETVVRYAMQDKIRQTVEGNTHYGNIWVGSHTVFCLHKSGLAADNLSVEVKRELAQFAPAMVEEFGLFKFQCTEVGSVSKIEESNEGFVVPVTVGWAYHMGWILSRESHKLTHIDFRFEC